MDRLLTYLTSKANRASTMTEFLKSIQYNDRYGCITLPNKQTSIFAEHERVYPVLNDCTVSMYLKDTYRSIKSGHTKHEAPDTTQQAEPVDTTTPIDTTVTSEQRLILLKALDNDQLYTIACTYDHGLINDNPFYYSRSDLYDMILDAEYPLESMLI